MTPLEQHCRLLMFAYPAGYRRERAEEILGTLLEATPSGRAWPLPRDVGAIVTGGLRARGAQHRRLSTAANLRLAALFGCAIYLSFCANDYLTDALIPRDSSLPAAAAALLICAAIVLAWLARGAVAIVAALAAATAGAAYQVSARAPVVAILAVVLPLAMLALLVRGAERPPRLWLWLPSLIVVAPVLARLGGALHWDAGFLWAPSTFLWIVVVASAVAWIGIDARPAVSAVIFLGLHYCQATISMLRSPLVYEFGRSSAYVISMMWVAAWPWLVTALVVGLLALWRLRRQAVL